MRREIEFEMIQKQRTHERTRDAVPRNPVSSLFITYWITYPVGTDDLDSEAPVGAKRWQASAARICRVCPSAPQFVKCLVGTQLYNVDKVLKLRA